MTINTQNLPADVSAYIQAELGSGKFKTAEEFVAVALRERRDQEQHLAELRKKIDEGLNDFARGDFIEIKDAAAHRALFDELKAEVIKDSSVASAKP